MAKMKAISPAHHGNARTPEETARSMMQHGDDEASTARRRSTRWAAACPIMIQIPVFIALYWVLLSSVEMRNAPWIRLDQGLVGARPLLRPAGVVMT
jgi:YidC/Oxa1 family membrane protein insertase